MQVPIVTMIEAGDPSSNANSPGYRVGVALDELVAWAKDNGATDEELEERLQESLDRYDEELAS